MPIQSSQNHARADATRPLRSDAAENRTRILDAARRTFAERGLDAAMSEVVRRSGVGAATVYRRFPTREHLIVAVFSERVQECVEAVLEASRDPDPWRGFSTVVESLCTMDADSRGLAQAFLAAYPSRVDFGQERAQAEQAFSELVQRAKAAGQLRPDFARSDLNLLLVANGGLTYENAATRLAASRRLATLMLKAFRACDPYRIS